MKSATISTRYGSSDASQIYLAVGLALTFWEAAEDVLMGVFHHLCGVAEPTAFEIYVASNRSTRGKMLNSAFARYETHFLPNEISEIRAAIKALDKLAATRNQIAHGHVSKIGSTINGIKTMDGFFLVPSLSELGQHILRDIRYAHTAAEIDAWREKVRFERARIMDADHAAQQRKQAATRQFSHSAMMTRSMAQALVEGSISAEDFTIVPNARTSDDTSS